MSAARGRCQDCGKVWDDADLLPFENATDLEPGDEVPLGRCPALPDGRKATQWQDNRDEDTDHEATGDEACYAQCLLVKPVSEGTVVVSISGGVGSVEKTIPGVVVEIWDYDEGKARDETDPAVQHDLHGNPFVNVA